MIDLYRQFQNFFTDCHDVSYPLPSWCGSGYVRSICPRKGMLLVLEEYRLYREMSVTTSKMPLPLGISYCLSGRVNWALGETCEQFTTRRGRCDLVFATNTNGKTTYKADEPVAMVNIMLCPGLLQSYFDASATGPDGMTLPGLQATGRDVIHRSQEMPGFIHKIVRQLMRSPCRRMSDKLFIQSKVLELVAFQLDQLDPPDRTVNACRENPADRTMISRTKSILQSRMQSPPSLRDLAHMLGTNETRLKKCFAAGCGTTVYGYLTACRMERACELLEDDDLTLAQIGVEVGYAEAAHFSRAFTRYFGLPPSRYRRNLRALP